MFFSIAKCSDAPSAEAERINRLSDNAGDKHLAHVSCPSHRCRITGRSVTAAPLTVAFAAAATAATATFAVCAAGPEYSCTSLGSPQQPLNIHLLCFCLKALSSLSIVLVVNIWIYWIGHVVVNVCSMVWTASSTYFAKYQILQCIITINFKFSNTQRVEVSF